MTEKKGTDDTGLPSSPGQPGQPVFYYNRQRRLENGPEEVRRAYQNGHSPKGGLLHVLTANRALRSMLFAILILCAVVLATTFLDRTTNAVEVAGIPVVAKAFAFEDLVYISIILGTETAVEEILEPVAVLAEVSAIDVNGVVIASRELAGIYSGRKLVIRTTMSDYEVFKVSVGVKIDKTERILSVSVDRN